MATLEERVTALEIKTDELDTAIDGVEGRFTVHEEADVHPTVLEDYEAVNVKCLEKTGKKIWDAWQEAWEKVPPPFD